MSHAEPTLLAFAAALILLMYLSSERERMFTRFIEAIQQGSISVSTLQDHRLVGEFPGHRFWMNAGLSDSGRRQYALAVKAHIDSVRVGPFSFGNGTLGGYAMDTQTMLASQFSRLLSQNRRFELHSDEGKAPFEFREP